VFKRVVLLSDSIAEGGDIGSQQVSFLGNGQRQLDGMIAIIAKVSDLVDSRMGKRVLVTINQDEFHAF